jgi:hypothetical protein
MALAGSDSQIRVICAPTQRWRSERTLAHADARTLSAVCHCAARMLATLKRVLASPFLAGQMRGNAV